MTAVPTKGATHSLANLGAHSAEMRRAIEASTRWLSNHAGEILIAIVIGVILYLGMALLNRILCRMRDRGGTESGIGTLLGRTFARTTHIFMAMAAARLVVGYTYPPAPVLDTTRFLFTVVAVFQCAIWAREFIIGLIERRTNDEAHGETLVNAMGLIRISVTVALFAVASVMVLDNVGVNVTGLVAGLGIGGIAIGLAAQGIFSDLFAALSIIFDQPFRQGETIQYDNTVATVEHIGLKTTRLRSVEGERKIISNANLLEKEITNFEDVSVRRFSMPIGVIYQTPPEKAERIPEILKEAIESAGAEFQRAGFSGFGDSSLDFDVLFFIHGHSLNEAVAMRHKVGMTILKRFAKEGLEFAYPTQTTFTAAPDGTMIYPFLRPQDAEMGTGSA